MPATHKKAAKKPSGTKKKASAKASGGDKTYTDPALRERLKKKITAGTKGGRAGQWSARKAQLLAHEYEAAGGGYAGGRSASQRHLKAWTDEEWQTKDGQPAQRGKTMARYLPKQAWDKLSPAEKKATDAKKQAVSKTGKQFVANTPAAKRAGAKARKSTAAGKPKSKANGAKRKASAKKSAK